MSGVLRNMPLFYSYSTCGGEAKLKQPCPMKGFTILQTKSTECRYFLELSQSSV